jgi:hypothetical protein
MQATKPKSKSKSKSKAESKPATAFGSIQGFSGFSGFSPPLLSTTSPFVAGSAIGDGSPFGLFGSSQQQPPATAQAPLGFAGLKDFNVPKEINAGLSAGDPLPSSSATQLNANPLKGFSFQLTQPITATVNGYAPTAGNNVSPGQSFHFAIPTATSAFPATTATAPATSAPLTSWGALPGGFPKPFAVGSIAPLTPLGKLSRSVLLVPA